MGDRPGFLSVKEWEARVNDVRVVLPPGEAAQCSGLTVSQEIELHLDVAVLTLTVVLQPL